MFISDVAVFAYASDSYSEGSLLSVIKITVSERVVTVWQWLTKSVLKRYLGERAHLNFDSLQVLGKVCGLS